MGRQKRQKNKAKQKKKKKSSIKLKLVQASSHEDVALNFEEIKGKNIFTESICFLRIIANLGMAPSFEFYHHPQVG
jgi:hypothetical protein